MKIYKDGEHIKTCKGVYGKYLTNDVILENVSLKKKRMTDEDTGNLLKLLAKGVYDLFTSNLELNAPYEYEYFMQKKGNYTGVAMVEKRESSNYIVFTHDNGYNLRYNENDIPIDLITKYIKI